MAIVSNYTSPVGTAAIATGSSTTTPSNATSAAYENSRVVKAGPGVLYGLTGFSSLASAQWIQIHDATAVPADTAIPAVIINVGATSNFSVDFGIYGRQFANGIVLVNSTTGPTKTIGAANCWFDARFV